VVRPSTLCARRAALVLLVLATTIAADGPAPPEPVSFSTADGGTVHADLYGAGERGVVLAHGGRFDKASWREQALALAAAGFRVLALDFRGYGASRGGRPTTDPYADLHLDVLAAVRYLRGNGAKSVAVVGGSMGATAAAEAAVDSPGAIDRLVLLAPGAIDAPERVAGPKLYVITRDDPRADGSPRLVGLREQFERAPEPKELLVLEGSAHAQFIFATADGPRLLAEILRFLTDPPPGGGAGQPAGGPR
jgi:pimeloyl-ACP methyl ester carboxylesterase